MFNDNNSKNNEDMVPDEEESQKSIKSFLYVDDDERNQTIENHISHQKIEDNIQKQKAIKEPISPCDQRTKPSINININIQDDSLKNEQNEICEFLTIGKKRGRNSSGEHNKFSDDNLRRKVKHIVLSDMMKFINNKISELYKGNIGNGIFRKELLTINQKQKANAKVQFNQEFLNKKLGDIFSEDISTRFTIYPLNHNRQVITDLRNETDESKRIYFNNLFNISFLDCLKHFRGDIVIDELIGLSGMKNVEETFKEDYEYLETLQYYIMNYEDITKNKKKRNRKKKDEK
jgi:predicted RNA binding protein with dsRBD fold (UPF0201 family)